MEQVPQHDNPVAATVSCVLAIDGGDRLAKEWLALSNGYIPAIIKQMGTLHPQAQLEIASITINSLRPTSSRPLHIRPFQPAATFVQTMPALVATDSVPTAKWKGKGRESTADIDFAVLEGLVAATSMLEARKSRTSYLLVVSAQDIPTVALWEDDTPHALPRTSLWPDLLPDVTEKIKGLYLSDAWRALIYHLSANVVHLCTITTRYLPRLEELQRQVTASQSSTSQSLPNLQDPEHAILLSGFQPGHAPTSMVNPNKRGHSDSISVSYPSNGRNNQQQLGLGTPSEHPNKRLKKSPGAENAGLPGAVPAASEMPSREAQQVADTQQSYIQQEPQGYQVNSMSLDLPPSMQPQQPQQQAPGAARNLTAQEMQARRDEVKSQMKQFLTGLAKMTKEGNISMEKAKITAEKVRAEAMKKLQLLDVLEQTQSQNNSSNQDAGQVQLALQSGGDGSQSASAALPSAAQAALDAQQPPLVPQPSNPAWNAAQQQTHQRQQSTSSTTPQMQQSGTTGQAWQKQPQQPQGADGSVAVQQVQQVPQTAPQSVLAQSSASAQGSPRKGQQQQPTPVWSGPIQWAMIDPISKMKRDLAFYVEARPVRASAVAELTNVQWPTMMEVSSIYPMGMQDLQKYATDHKIQVIQFGRASAPFVESMGMSAQQNDTLYQLLAKNLEGKQSVGVVKLPGTNRGIVIVSLPQQSKLVGLVFVTTPLPPKTPASGQPRQGAPTMQQQQQAAYQTLQQQQQAQGQPPPPPISKGARDAGGVGSNIVPSPQLSGQAAFQPQQHQQNYQANQPAQPGQQQFMPSQNFTSPSMANQQSALNAGPFNAFSSGSATTSAPQFTDAQFQEMLAQMQRAQQMQQLQQQNQQ